MINQIPALGRAEADEAQKSVDHHSKEWRIVASFSTHFDSEAVITNSNGCDWDDVKTEPLSIAAS